MGSIGFTWVYLGSPGFTWVHLGSLGFTWVHLGSLGLILVDMGDLGCWVLNLRNESTNTYTDRGFLGCLDILLDLINEKSIDVKAVKLWELVISKVNQYLPEEEKKICK